MEQRALARQSSSWADLDPELLSLIVSKCTTTASVYVFLRRVCHGWRRSLTIYSPKPPLPSPQLPFLLLPPRSVQPPSPVGKIFHLPFLNPFRRPSMFSLPQLENTRGRICVGSSHGSLITLGPDSSVSLLNPVTTDLLPLCSLSSIDNAILNFNPDTFPEYHLTQKGISHSQYSIIHRAVLSSDPAEDPNFTVLLFLSGLTDCCFTWSGRGDTWSRHVHEPILVDDVVFIRGVFITIDRSIGLGCFDFRNLETGLVVKWSHIFPTPTTGDAFLVNKNGSLLIVMASRLHDRIELLILASRLHDPSQLYIPRGYINVYRILVGADEFGDGSYKFLRRVSRLRGHALFVGHGCSLCVSVRHFPWLIEDTVYFPHVYCKLEKAEGEGERRIAMYQGAIYQNIISVTSGAESMKVFDVENSRYADFWASPRPFWVTPNLNRS